MALDVQPLSKTRRGLMLLVLLALFGGSLGLAQVLVRRRAAAAAVVVTVDWRFPGELNKGVPALRKVEGVVVGRGGVVKGRKRWAAGIIERLDPRTGGDASAEAGEIFERMVDAKRVVTLEEKLAGREGIEVEGMGQDGDFGILRMVIVGDEAVAICYSGPGEITDGDRLFFDGMCKRAAIREEVPRTGK